MPKLKDFDLQIGDAIFTYQGSWLNQKILWFSRWRTPDKYDEKIAHVAMYVGKKDGVDMVFEADWKGLSLNKLDSYHNKKYDIHVASIKDIIIDAYHLAKLEMYVELNLKKKYAFKQLAAIAFKKVFRLKSIGDWDRDAMMCSETYCDTAKHVWHADITKNQAGTSPLDIYYSKAMVIKTPKEVTP